MKVYGTGNTGYGLEKHGIENVKAVYWNLPTALLYEEAVRRGEGRLGSHGPLIVHTGKHTGRSPNDKFIVREPSSADQVDWGKVNRAIEPKHFDSIRQRMMAYLQGKELFVQDCYAGADPAHRLLLRVITKAAWQSLFARNMFICPPREKLAKHVPQFTVIHAPGFRADPKTEGTNSETAVVVHFGERLVLIGGTFYAGEIKKSIFSVLNYMLPRENVLSMHCSANYGPEGDVALFFGLSGTGKTTLSADESRTLIGDDEHGWSDQGVFNLEGGCYAKVIRLSAEAEPEIYSTTRRFGTILENVVFDEETGQLDLDDDSITENTRGAYPIDFIPNASPDGMAGHPKTVIMLTADAFGVLPPISKLTLQQAMYHFLSGYTAKVAGTEIGVTEPKATFSTCFGAPFMVLPPTVYADMLGEKIAQHQADVWLVNTGWSGGPYGVGKRVKIAYTRAMVHAALDGSLAKAPRVPDPNFGVAVPTECPNVPAQILNPRNTWKDKAAYDVQAKKLSAMFVENFKAFAGLVDKEVETAGLVAK